MPPRARRRLGGHEAHENVKEFDPNVSSQETEPAPEPEPEPAPEPESTNKKFRKNR